MPGFLYFLPDVTPEQIGRRLERDLLKRHGLADVLDDCEHVPDDVVVSAGKLNDTHGSILVPKSPDGTEPRDWKINQALQTWADRIGWETDQPPTPADLLRKTIHSGARVADRLDQDWRIPIARSPRGHGTLPAAFVRDDAGVTRAVDPQYQELWELSGQVRDWIYGQYTPDDVDVWKYDSAATILSTNYRVGPRELNILHQLQRAVITTETIDPILVAFVDWDLPSELLEALEKKTRTPTAA